MLPNEGEIQACYPNLYLITLREWFMYEVFGLPDLKIDVTIESLEEPFMSSTNSSFFDETSKLHYVYLNYCHDVATEARLSATILGEHLGDSPKIVKIVPGPYLIQVSDIY